jgi:hypothetical protein
MLVGCCVVGGCFLDVEALLLLLTAANDDDDDDDGEEEDCIAGPWE